MTLRIRVFSSRFVSCFCSVLLIVLSVATSVIWWNQLGSSFEDLGAHEYSLNKASGVHVSLFTDLREPIGTKSNGNAYGYYLAELARTFAGAAADFVWAIERPGADWLTQLGPNRRLVAVTPITDDNYVLGIQRSTKISIIELENFPASLIGHWVELSDGGGNKMDVVVASGTESEITVVGDIPFNFFPSTIKSLRGARRAGQQTTLVSTTSLGSNVRGGIVSGTDGRGIYLYVPGWAGKLPFRPAVGDTVTFGSGEEREIDYVMKLGGGYFVLLRGPLLQPHFFNRADIVTVTATNSAPPEGLQLRVNPVSNAQYFNGRERKLRVAVDPAYPTTSKTLMSLDSGNRPIFVESSSNGNLEVDVQVSLAMQACLAMSQPDGGVFFDELAGVLDGFFGIAAEWSLQNRLGMPDLRSCLIPESPIVSSLSNAIASWHDLTRKQAQLISTALTGNKEISTEEVWYRSLSIDLVAATNDENVKPDQAPVSVDAKTIWEIYPGSMANVLFGKENPAPSELLIHALSQEDRREYYEAFASVAPDYFSFAKPRQFTPWLINWHWPLFKDLLQHYRLDYSNSDFGFWRRDAATSFESSNEQPISVSLPVELPRVSINDNCGYALREITVSYKIRNSMSSIPILGSSTRYFISISGVDTSLPPPTPISLPAETGEFSFPVFSRASDSLRLDFEKLGPLADLADIEFQAVTASRIEADSQELEELFLENMGAKMIAAASPACAVATAPVQ